MADVTDTCKIHDGLLEKMFEFLVSNQFCGYLGDGTSVWQKRNEKYHDQFRKTVYEEVVRSYERNQ